MILVVYRQGALQLAVRDQDKTSRQPASRQTRTKGWK